MSVLIFELFLKTYVVQHIARRLMIINDQGDYLDPSHLALGEDDAIDLKILNQDKNIFERAKLINCAQFRNIVIEDFLKGLLGIPLVGPSANFDVLAVSSSMFQAPDHLIKPLVRMSRPQKREKVTTPALSLRFYPRYISYIPLLTTAHQIKQCSAIILDAGLPNKSQVTL